MPEPYFDKAELVPVEGSTSATWALALIAVVLRFLARRSSKAGYGWDDWLIIPTLVREGRPSCELTLLMNLLGRCLGHLA